MDRLRPQTHYSALTPDSPDSLVVTQDDDDAISDYSERKPLHAFDSALEDGLHTPRRKRRWWGMTIRARRRNEDIGEEKEGEALLSANGKDAGLLADVLARRAAVKRKRRWYNYCIFGGISWLTIMGFLLLINLTLGIATLLWSGDYIDNTLRNWGKPGSGTEDLAWYPTDFLRDINPIPCHSHNDYWRGVPLFSALRAGCTGVEADVWLFDEDLYVGHNTASLQRNRTFQSLYIKPLVDILEMQNPHTEFYNGTMHGVFDTDPGKSLTLLVDVKTSGAETWPWVLTQLEPLRERGWLSFVENNTLHTRPITVVGTGNTPFDVLTQNRTYRDTFFDAPLDTMWESRHRKPSTTDLNSSQPSDEPDDDDTSTDPDPVSPKDVGQGFSGVLPNTEFNTTNSYYASVSFGKAVGHIWRGRLSPQQLRTIRGQVRGAHRRGLKARYWDLPSWPLGLRNHVWEILVQEGVDVLNVDDLRAASRLVW